MKINVKIKNKKGSDKNSLNDFKLFLIGKSVLKMTPIKMLNISADNRSTPNAHCKSEL